MIRIRLTSVAVDDQARGRAFYVDKLGFQVKHDIPMGPVSWLTVVSPADPDGVELSIEPGGQRPEFRTFQDWMRAEGIPWTAFAVDDIDAEYERLSGLGIEFRGPPADMGPTRGCTLDDGCGNLIMLYQG